MRCNKCNCKFKHVTSIELSMGFGSIHDGETWNMAICDDCLEVIIKSFKLSPNGFNEGCYDPETTDQEHQMIFENWKETGKWEEMMCVPYEKLIAYKDYYEDEYINECIKKYHPNKPLLI